MLARVRAAAVLGVQAFPVLVEADLQSGLPTFSTVGLPDEAVRESRDRVRAAIVNSGFAFPAGRVTVNLAPADLRKEGSAFDLAIAVGLLAAQGLARAEAAAGLLLVGELSLDGGLKQVRGVLPVALAARDAAERGLIVPPANAAEAALVRGLEVYPARSLAEVVAHLNGEAALERAAPPVAAEPDLVGGEVALEEVRGQQFARRALEIAAAGGHNLLFVGPPGSGKTLLSRCLPGILPPLSFEEALETTRIHSVAGLVSPARPLVLRRPFRAPHHSVSNAGLIGGGSHPRPGEASLAHNGVLFLDELPEFSRSVLENLRQPLEAGEVTIARAALTLTYPARFMLVAAMNPCKCGFRGDRSRVCGCSPREVDAYRSRISGPLLDRIDLHVEVPALSYAELAAAPAGEGTATVRARVERARAAQHGRFGAARLYCNAQMGAREVREHCRHDEGCARLLEGAMRALGLSARGYARVLKVARTIADLAAEPRIGLAHVAEAIQYRERPRAMG
ncbi:MAG TPA: YifB family Mg chelatase-like AAA ATPase [Candidatus Methanoperedens sp.]|nr:YifB family Mg chelatase-like AAA ATPase [Candidatus Methanoperedens sp.]